MIRSKVSVISFSGALVIRLTTTICLKLSFRYPPLDTYTPYNTTLMEVVTAEQDGTIWHVYKATMVKYEGSNVVLIISSTLYPFYKKIKNAYAIIATDKSALYNNFTVKRCNIK